MAEVTTAPRVGARWTERRRRAGQLGERYPFAAETLALYQALLDVQEQAFRAALGDQPRPEHLDAYIAERVLPAVVEVTGAAGPALLAAASAERVETPSSRLMVGTWLRGEDQPPVDRYLARAAAGPVLEALGPAVFPAPGGRPDGRRCPRCGGPPQVSFFADAGEALVTAPRGLLCARCASTWTHQRMTCPGCGEASTARLPIYAETECFPHVRADACQSCRRYLLTVDLRKDSEAVPEVDELAALPVDLYVQDGGFAKIAPNLMGIG